MVSAFGTATVRPCGISNDRTTLYASGTVDGTLRQSTNDGATWTTLYTFMAGWVVSLLIETDDGEAVAFINCAAVRGRVYKSSGWAASHSTATWTEVLVTEGSYVDRYGANSATFGDDAIVPGSGKYGAIGCYGNQTTSSGDQTTKGRYAYWTEDYGVTWVQVFDLLEWATARGVTANLHIHSAAYDPWWDRIWIAWGDTAIDGKLDVVFSDDHGSTWSQLEDTFSTFSAYPTIGMQSTTVLPREDVIVFGSDPTRGIWVIPRKGYRKYGPPSILAMHSTGTSNTSISTHTNSLRGTPGAPVTHAWDSQLANMKPGVAISWDGGKNFRRVIDWPATVISSIDQVWGPTVSGKYVIGCHLSTTYYLVVGTLVSARDGVLNRILRATGDGSTQSFTLPHYLGKKPDAVLAYAQSSAALGAFTVTADTTNVTVTFTAAPANSAHIQVSLLLSA